MSNHTDKRTVVLDFKYPQSPTSYLKYQSYYLMGMNNHPLVHTKYRPLISLPLISMIQHNVRGAGRLWKVVNKKPGQRLVSNHVGRYVIESPHGTVRFAIDSADGLWIRDDDALQWSDIYFKTNKWRDVSYPGKTSPLINGNGTLTHEKIRKLKSLRSAKKDLDLVYWAKIWEPGSFDNDKSESARNLVEHQIRLFESLARVRCKKSLLAILPKHLDSVSLSDCKSRLESAGVTCQHGWGTISSDGLWQGLASAKLVFLRPGNHLCISWRMIDLLCMGACVFYDGAPFPQWYKPICEGEHYFDGGCRINSDYALPARNRYQLLQDKLEDVLSRDSMIHQVRDNAAEYFDRHGNPRAVAQHILDVTGSVNDGSH